MLFNLYNCKEALQRLDDYVDRELTPDEMQRVQRHLKICKACAKKFAFEASVIERVREKLQRISAPEDLLASISLALSESEQE